MSDDDVGPSYIKVQLISAPTFRSSQVCCNATTSSNAAIKLPVVTDLCGGPSYSNVTCNDLPVSVIESSSSEPNSRFHKCKHERNWNHDVKKKMERITTYIEAYCTERPYAPPRKLMRPPPHSNLLCGNMEQMSTYRNDFKTPMPDGSDTYRPKQQKFPPPKPKMEKKSTYMEDYRFEMSDYERSLLYWRRRNAEERVATEKAQVSPLSKPKRPPRPYDYSKCDKYETGPLYLPKDTIRAKLDELSVIVRKYHCDNAVNSYTTGTTVKDDFRLNADTRHVTCCRPETQYHPDLLHTCIACHEGKDHAPCPMWLYPKPPEPLKEKPYIGPTPALRECSVYENTYRSPLLHSFLIPDPVCSKKCHPEELPCPRLARNLPIPVGFERCH